MSATTTTMTSKHDAGEIAHDVRLRAIAVLRDLLTEQHDYPNAVTVQWELLECEIRRLGANDLETLASREKLGMILLDIVDHNPGRSEQVACARKRSEMLCQKLPRSSRGRTRVKSLFRCC